MTTPTDHTIELLRRQGRWLPTFRELANPKKSSPSFLRDLASIVGRFVLGASTDHLLELTERERDRIFNLGYFTWVAQRGISLSNFEARRSQTFWLALQFRLDEWDEMIVQFNRRVRTRAVQTGEGCA